MKTIDYTVLPEEDGMMLKNWLQKKGISTRSTARLKHYGKILINGEAVTVRAFLQVGNIVELHFPEDEKPAVPENISVPIVYEDDDLIVMDKPPHMPVHPSKNLQSGTLANAFAYYAASRGHLLAFRAVNRLDRGTSGLVVAALNPVSAGKLAGAVDKQYICVCRGKLDDTGRIDLPIQRKKKSKMERCVATDGQRAVTNYRRIYTNGDFSVALVTLETGRTHQIRVHFSHIGHALIGDTMYGEADSIIDRQALHCMSVSYTHPITGLLVDVKTDLPDDIKAFLTSHGAKNVLGDLYYD